MYIPRFQNNAFNILLLNCILMEDGSAGITAREQAILRELSEMPLKPKPD